MVNISSKDQLEQIGNHSLYPYLIVPDPISNYSINNQDSVSYLD